MHLVHIVRMLFMRPAERIQSAFVGRRIALEPFLEQPRDGALAAAHGTVQQQHAFFNAIALGGALEGIDELRDRFVQTEDRIGAAVIGIIKEAVVRLALPRHLERVRTVRHDHLVHALKRIASDARLLANQVQIGVEAAAPVLLAELVQVLRCCHRAK